MGKPDLYTIVEVARDEDMKEQIGRDIFFGLVDYDKVRSFPIKKETPFNLFKEVVAKELGIPVQFQRFWICLKRESKSYSPSRPLTPYEELQSVGKLRGFFNDAHYIAKLKLFLEVEFGPDLRPIPLPNKIENDFLLFFKLYEPEKREIRFAGRLFVKKNYGTPPILSELNQLAGFAPDVDFEFYKEIGFDPCIVCKHLDKRKPFQLNQIQDGDIIYIQKITPIERKEEYEYPDVPSFLEYIHSRQATVHPKAGMDEISKTAKFRASFDLVGSLPTTRVLAEPTPTEEDTGVTLESSATSDSSHVTGQNDMGRLSAADEVLKYISASAPSAEALAAFGTVSLYARSNLATLCMDGSYDELTAALKLLVEQGGIPLKITSKLKELIESLEREIPEYVAAEKEFSQGGEEHAAQHEEIKARMELAMRKCEGRTDIVANYDAMVTELEAELAQVKAKRAEAMTNLKSSVDEMQPLKRSFEDGLPKSERLIVKRAKLTAQKGASLGTWTVVKDELKNYF